MKIEQVFWIADYLRYLWNSHSRHGTHSPFIYSFADEVLYQKDQPPGIDLIELERSRLLNHPEYKSIPPRKFLALLFRYLQWNQTSVHHFLEIGSSFNTVPQILFEVDPSTQGTTFAKFSASLPLEDDSYLTPHPNHYTITINNDLKADQINNLLQEKGPLDFVIINQSCKEIIDIEALDAILDGLSEQGVLIVQRLDEFWSQRDMWDILIRRPRATANIDLFKMGMIFVRKEQLKESFLLRY